MKSLRTDDIPGARPTFRHAPKAFIRERQIPSYNFQTNYDMSQQNMYYPQPEPQYISQVNMSESQMQSPRAMKDQYYHEQVRNHQ